MRASIRQWIFRHSTVVIRNAFSTDIAEPAVADDHGLHLRALRRRDPDVRELHEAAAELPVRKPYIEQPHPGGCEVGDTPAHAPARLMPGARCLCHADPRFAVRCAGGVGLSLVMVHIVFHIAHGPHRMKVEGRHFECLNPSPARAGTPPRQCGRGNPRPRCGRRR